jgi:hypothetical protein
MALCLTQARPIRALITHAGDRQSENSSKLAPHSTRMNLSDFSGMYESFSQRLNFGQDIAR